MNSQPKPTEVNWQPKPTEVTWQPKPMLSLCTGRMRTVTANVLFLCDEISTLRFDHLQQRSQWCVQRIYICDLNNSATIGVRNFTMSKFAGKMTTHCERLATARTEFGEVSDLQIQRFESDLHMAEGDDGYMMGSDMPFWQRDRLGVTPFRK